MIQGKEFTEMKFMKRFATQDMKLRKEAVPLLVNGQAAAGQRAAH